ncbi:MAG: amidohydrolase family protein [Dehalococcoidia bacterium]
MIVDFHTHIFPSQVRDRRQEYLQRDATFAEMYAESRAKIVGADDLLRSMDEAGVDVSVALGFAWGGQELCRLHNDYLLEAAAGSGRRIVPFCTVNPAAAGAEAEVERCAAAGARGLGELRPDSQGWELADAAGDWLAGLAQKHGLIQLFHVTEPLGHQYPGKQGGGLAAFYEFVVRHPEVTTVGAHLAGGLPLYASMPEVVDSLAHLHLDTAAQPLLYDRAVYGELSRHLGAERLLLGSDYPLIEQGRQIGEIRSGVSDVDSQLLILGENARRLLGLGDDGGPG